MKNQELIPTPLIDSKQAKKIVIVEDENFSLPQHFRQSYRFCLTIGSIIYLHLMVKYFSEDKAPKRREKKAILIRTLFGQRGGLWIKVGQLLSMRSDLFSQEFCLELSKLQDSSTGFPFHHVKRIVEENLHAPIEKIFSHFEEKPLAAASIGQVHLAYLKKEKKTVVVKIQRPLIEKQFERDLNYVQKAVYFLELLSIYPQLQWEELIAELKQMFLEELDYRIEISSGKRMKKNLKKHKVYAPSIYSQYCTQRVIVMEFVRGVYMSDYIKALQTNPIKVQAWCKENNIEPAKVADRLIISLNRQLYEDNLFHGDLHPGNIILLRDSRIAFIDFGSIGKMERGFLERIILYHKALSSRNYSKAVDFFFTLMPSLPNIDLNEIKRKMIMLLRNWELRTMTKNLPYKERSFNGINEELINMMKPYKLTMEWGFLRITRTTSTLDGSVLYLHPELDYLELNRKAHKGKAKRDFKRQQKNSSILKVVQLKQDIQKIPEEVSELLTFQLDSSRRGAKVFQMTITKSGLFLGFIAKTVSLGFKVCLCFLLYAFFYKHYEWLASLKLGGLENFAQDIALYPPDIWALLFVANIYFLHVSTSLSKKMNRKDTRKNM